MATTLATGTQIAIASTYGTAKAFSSITNATEAVASFAADPSLAANDMVEITSGWPLLNTRLARVKSVSGVGPYLVTLEGIDTSSTTLYPAGEGAGSVREITAWQSIPLIANASISGGDQQYIDTPELALPVTGRLPSERNGITISMPTYFEATPSAGVAAAVAAQTGGTPVGFRATHPAGDKIYANGYWSVRRSPTMERGQARQSQIDCSWTPQGETIYAS